MNLVLPPLRRKILRQIIKIVFLFACLGFALLIVMHESVSNPKKLIIQNHNTTNHVLKMIQAWHEMNSANNTNSSNDIKQFDLLLSEIDKLKLNSEETENLNQIENLWIEKKKMGDVKFSHENYSKMRESLIHFINLNQVHVINTLSKQVSFSKKIAFFAGLIFLLGLGVSIYFSERLSSSIAQPLKKMTEALQNKKKFNEKLKWPIPNSLEIKVLILELNELWKRLAELHTNNVENLELQKNEMETIFAAMEDAAVVFDEQNKIQYYNKGFLDVLGICDNKLIAGNKWDDLSIMSDSYLRLRTMLRKDNYDEVLFTCTIENESRIYRARKKYVTDSHQNKTGTILLLHDITKKLPPQKVTEILEAEKLEKNETTSK